MTEIEKIEFRPATPGDESFLGEMFVASIYWKPDEEPLDFQTYCTRSPLSAKGYVLGFGDRPGDIGVIAETRTQKVGAAWARNTLIPLDPFTDQESTSDFSYEVSIAVRSEFRMRGIGARLLDHLSKMAVEVDREYLMLGSDEENAAATRLYQSYGFVPYVDALDEPEDDSGHKLMIKHLTK